MQDLFRGDVSSYVSAYDFLSQMRSYDDADLERLHAFCRMLLPRLQGKAGGDEAADQSVGLAGYKVVNEQKHKLDMEAGKAEPMKPMGLRKALLYKKAVEPTEEENDDEPKNQKIGFHYKTVPLHGFSIEVENNSLEAYAKALYQGEILDFGYSLTANTYLSSAKAYSMDLNYALRRELTVGSRYSFKSDNLNLISYTGVYSSLVLDELNKGLNIGIYYDKIGLDKKGDQFSLKIKNDF